MSQQDLSVRGSERKEEVEDFIIEIYFYSRSITEPTGNKVKNPQTANIHGNIPV